VAASSGPIPKAPGSAGGYLLDINPLSTACATISLENGNLRLGALARMSDVAANAEIQQNYPVVADALKLAASPQLRNMATLGGNVLQPIDAPTSATLLMKPATSATRAPAVRPCKALTAPMPYWVHRTNVSPPIPAISRKR
jgi:CO/xanthine dehydrogenase FAD-binding subunit